MRASRLCSRLAVAHFPDLNLRRGLSTSSRYEQHNDIPLKNPASRRAISLLDELFPQESTALVRSPAPKAERHVPRHDIGTQGRFDSGTRIASLERAKKVNRRYLSNDDVLLVLRNGGRHLVEDDFLRILPQGEHIEGWVRDNEILKVLPERDLCSLQLTGVYYVLFPNLASAEGYRKHAARLHHLAKTHISASLTRPIPPPPGPNGTGYDGQYTLQSYTLIPPSQNLDIRVIQRPFFPPLQRILENDGYPAIVSGRRSQYEVMIAPEDFRLSLLTLRHAISRDCRERALHWSTVGKDSGIRIVDIEQNLAPANKKEADPSHAEHRSRKALPMFVISLRDEAEAKRFIATWHRRDIASLVETSPGEEHRCLVINAERIM